MGRKREEEGSGVWRGKTWEEWVKFRFSGWGTESRVYYSVKLQSSLGLLKKSSAPI